MGTRGQGSGSARARRLGPVVAAVAGATVVGAAAAVAVAGGRHRRVAGARAATRADPTAPPAADGLATLGGSATAAQPRDTPAVPTAPPVPDTPDTPAAPTAPPVSDTPTAPTAAPPHQTPAPPADAAEPPGARTPPPAVEPLPPRVTGDPPRRSRLAAGLVAAGLVVGAVAGIAAAARGDDGPAGTVTDTNAADDPPATTVTTLPPVTTDQAFALAARRLTTAGTFTYTGTVSATDVSHVRPMFWLAVSSTVEGQVAIATGRLHEVAVPSDGRAAETVTAGSDVWGRRAPTVEGLGDQAYEAIPGLSGPGSGPDGATGELPQARGAALLPAWLASATGAVDARPDERGRRRFQATIPASVFGEIERERQAVDATVLLTLDAAGTPVRVEIASAPDGPPLHLVFDIGGLGSPVAIEPPVAAAAT